MTESPRRVLVVATKAPHPPIGGGNVTLNALLTGLQRRGVEVRVVAVGEGPVTGAPYAVRRAPPGPRGWLGSTAAVVTGVPASLARYRVPSLLRAVESEVSDFVPDVVHLEQLHVAWLAPSLVGRVGVLLRQQNVESRLLTRLAAVSGGPVRWLLGNEAARMRRAEAAACSLAHVVAAISEVDACALANLAPGAHVRVLPAAWVGQAHGAPRRLAGTPAFMCIGSFDWLPNRDGAKWLLRDVWPIIRQKAPDALLHLAGPGSESLGQPPCGGVVQLGRVPDAAELYDPLAVALVPLRAGSGVRLRLLEAWAAGLPAVTTTVGGEGLVTRDGAGAILADSAPAFAQAALSVAADLRLRRELVAAGRERLQLHSIERVTERAVELYAETKRLGPGER